MGCSDDAGGTGVPAVAAGVEDSSPSVGVTGGAVEAGVPSATRAQAFAGGTAGVPGATAASCTDVPGGGGGVGGTGTSFLPLAGGFGGAGGVRSLPYFFTKAALSSALSRL